MLPFPANRLLRTLVLAPSTRLRNRHLAVVDSISYAAAPTLALVIRLEGRHPVDHYLACLSVFTVVAVVMRLLIGHWLGLYRRYWASASIDDALLLVAVSVVPTVLMCAAYCVGVGRAPGAAALPRSVPIVSGILSLLLLGSTRFAIRLAQLPVRLPACADARRALIIGAGDAGRRIAKELLAKPELGMLPLGFLDDDPMKRGARILGIPVVGSVSDLPDAARHYSAAQVIIAMPSCGGVTIRSLMTACGEVGIPAKIVPGISALLQDHVRVDTLRPVDIEDLLRRDPIKADTHAVAALLRGKCIMVTGGGGSIGSEICRQVLRCSPSDLVVVGHGENSVFDVVNELRTLEHCEGLLAGAREDGATRVHGVIADIRFRDRICEVVETVRPDIIFHAAAHKHVPLMESNPTEAVTNNVLGTKYLLTAARAAGVDRFVMISTDKAVNPTSVMGASKRAAELLVLRAAQETGKAYVTVRFGNVLGSRGSVIPTFRRQIAAGGPVTVSHPDMKRYFITIPEAVQLVLQAVKLGSGGEVFVLDMGDPVRIVDLARDLIELSGLRVGDDVEIKFTGPRPGEKLFEEMFLPRERYRRTEHAKILIAPGAVAAVPDNLDDCVTELALAARSGFRPAVIAAFKRLLPEFSPDEERYAAAAVAALPNEREESVLAAHGLVGDRSAVMSLAG